jgi:hypothetical protein
MKSNIDRVVKEFFWWGGVAFVVLFGFFAILLYNETLKESSREALREVLREKSISIVPYSSPVTPPPATPNPLSDDQQKAESLFSALATKQAKATEDELVNAFCISALIVSLCLLFIWFILGDRRESR